MADQKISGLTAATTLADTDELVIASSGTTKKITAANAKTSITAGSQPLDTELTALASVTSAADRVPYFTGVGTADVATFTSFGRSLVDNTDAAAARQTLGAVGVGLSLAISSGNINM